MSVAFPRFPRNFGPLRGEHVWFSRYVSPMAGRSATHVRSPRWGNQLVTEFVNVQIATNLRIQTLAINCHLRGSNPTTKPNAAHRFTQLSKYESPKPNTRVAHLTVQTVLAAPADFRRVRRGKFERRSFSPISREIAEIDGNYRRAHLSLAENRRSE